MLLLATQVCHLASSVCRLPLYTGCFIIKLAIIQLQSSVYRQWREVLEKSGNLQHTIYLYKYVCLFMYSSFYSESEKLSIHNYMPVIFGWMKKWMYVRIEQITINTFSSLLVETAHLSEGKWARSVKEVFWKSGFSEFTSLLPRGGLTGKGHVLVFVFCFVS